MSSFQATQRLKPSKTDEESSSSSSNGSQSHDSQRESDRAHDSQRESDMALNSQRETECERTEENIRPEPQLNDLRFNFGLPTEEDLAFIAERLENDLLSERSKKEDHASENDDVFGGTFGVVEYPLGLYDPDIQKLTGPRITFCNGFLSSNFGPLAVCSDIAREVSEHGGATQFVSLGNLNGERGQQKLLSEERMWNSIASRLLKFSQGDPKNHSILAASGAASDVIKFECLYPGKLKTIELISPLSHLNKQYNLFTSLANHHPRIASLAFRISKVLGNDLSDYSKHPKHITGATELFDGTYRTITLENGALIYRTQHNYRKNMTLLMSRKDKNSIPPIYIMYGKKDASCDIDASVKFHRELGFEILEVGQMPQSPESRHIVYIDPNGTHRPYAGQSQEVFKAEFMKRHIEV